ncbi:MAG: phosphatase PAP2 family protein [Micropruina sp.]|nr:MAG: phosphatase PAP2 family protein [Micropruina sp.]
MAQPPPPVERTIGERDLTDWHSRLGRYLANSFTAIQQWTSARLLLVVVLAVAAGLFAGAVMMAGEIYESVMEQDGVYVFDQPLMTWVMAHRNPSLSPGIALFSDSGGPVWMPVIGAVAALAMCLAWRRWTPLVLLLLGAAGSLALTVVGKRLVGRARPPLQDSIPPHEYSASFPSGHSLNSLVIAGLVAYLLLAHISSKVGRWLLVIGMSLYVVAMGLSRVYLGHHWLSDVLMAWVVGIAWLTVVITAHRLWLTRAFTRPADEDAARA